MTSRRYEQRARAEQAEATRRRILDAVVERLREAPAEPVSVGRIAAAAGVARSTVYAIFGSRAGLFDAVGADLFERAGYGRLIDATAPPDALDRLRGGIHAASEMFAAYRDVVRALHSMAQLDEQAVGDVVRRWEVERADGMAKLVRGLRDENRLRPGLTEKEAVHTLWVLTSFESFDLLFTGRGLTARGAAKVLAGAAERAVCRDTDDPA